MSVMNAQPEYPARLAVDYPETLDRLTTALRIFLVIPIAIILALVSGGAGGSSIGYNEAGDRIWNNGASIGFSISVATALMILFRQRYPRWWFDFQLALTRFSYRVGAYFFLLRDEYPSTEDEQAVHLEVDYPDAKQLSQWMPLVKWLLAIPHYVALLLLAVGLVIVVVVGWVLIILTGRYPRGLFDYVVGFGRWALRVWAYAFGLVTDRYPPFNMN
jgi:hypothetical protein